MQKILKHLYYTIQQPKNTPWIYSSKHEELSAIKPGQICVCTDVGEDLHDVTLRMANKLLSALTIFSYDRNRTARMLEALNRKDRFII